MKIYHGSDLIIEKPIFHAGNKHNDYGYGFYCTEYADMAREWGSSPGRNGYLNSYELRDGDLKILNLNDFHILTWLAVLLENRTFYLDLPLAREACSYLTDVFHIDYEEYDLVIGYRADDSYFSFARDFINGAISLRQLSEAMKLGGLGNQIVLKSRRAFDSIIFSGAEEVDSRIWYPLRLARDEKARKKYRSADKGYVRGEIYITKIIDEEMKTDDIRLQ